MKLLARILLVASLCASAGARADIYKCVDSAGHITYTNAKSAGGKGCSVLSRELPVSSIPMLVPRRHSGSAPSGEAAAGFPKVEPATQKARDSDRRHILEQEMAAEEKMLAEAQRQLAEQQSMRPAGGAPPQSTERLKSFQDRVQLHERNIESLRKEIGNLK